MTGLLSIKKWLYRVGALGLLCAIFISLVLSLAPGALSALPAEPYLLLSEEPKMTLGLLRSYSLKSAAGVRESEPEAVPSTKSRLQLTKRVHYS